MPRRCLDAFGLFFSETLPKIPIPFQVPNKMSSLRHHVLWFARQDGGSRFVFRFDHQGRDQRAAMVCDNFARTARHPYFYAGQGTTSGKCHSFWPSSAGYGTGWRFCSPPGRPALGSFARSSSPLWTTRRRHILPVKNRAPSSPKTQPKT